VLEDGELSEEEAADLAAVAQAHDLASEDITAANGAFVLALAHEALTDGKVTRAERAELTTIADLLGVPTKQVTGLLDRAEQARHARLSAGLADLPDPWPHGEPLRVGDKVVFTGCDDMLRNELERRSEELGVRVIGSVSAKTAMLVTDGSIDGTKAAKARALGTRTIDPTVYALLLKHLQPAVRIEAGVAPTLAVIGRPGDLVERRVSEPVAADSAASSGAPSPAAVRRWARDNGFEVGVRGRLPAEVVEAYISAN
jgi:DNA polymerase-3 subunit epsilon